MASFIVPKKPQILYAPMLSSFGGGSARGFGGPGIGGGLSEFVLTLTNGTSYSVNYDDGDSDSTINSFFSTNLASDPGYISSSGTSFYKPFNGYYAMELGVDCEVNIRCKGATGGYSYNGGWGRTLGFGRDIDATFTLSSGNTLVFGVGKTGQPDNGADNNSGGTGGGCTFCYKRVGGSDSLLVVGAGGSGTPVYQQWHLDQYSRGNRIGASGAALGSKGTGGHSSIRTARSTYSYWYGSTWDSGIGRSGAGGGGGGATRSGRLADGSTNSNMGNAILDTYSNGNAAGGYQAAQSNPKRGGWGCGGGHVSGNGYAGGGGGYFGGWECGSRTTSGTNAQYSFYNDGSGGSSADSQNNNMAPISFVDNAATSWNDNGIFGTPSSSSSVSDSPKGGEIVFTFNPA